MQDAETEELKRKIESGVYFEESRAWYAEIYHMPIAQRSYYIVVILLALMNMGCTLMAFLNVFPIVVPAPFITYSNNLWEEIPRIRRLATEELEDKNIAVMKFLISNYVENRESYDLSALELRYRNIWSQSSPNVFNEYKHDIDAANPYSLYAQYTNRFKRVVEIQSLDYDLGNPTSQAHVVFITHIISLLNNEETSHSKWRSDLVYKYTNFKVDQSLEVNSPVARFFGLTRGALKASGEKRKVVPMTFLVSDYKVKELLE